MHDLFNIDHTQYGKIRAEVLLIELLESADLLHLLDEVAISPSGSFNKAYKQDILSIEERENYFGLKKTIFSTSRAGLYDNLPDSFFHQTDTTLNKDRKSNTKEETLSSITKQKREERAARNFFRPFDQAFNYYRTLIELEERKAAVGFSNSIQYKLFERIWGGYNNDITPYQKNILFYIAPLAYQIVGSRKLTALCFEAILNAKVRIEEIYEQKIKVKEDKIARINHCSLGVDSILGAKSDELELTYRVYIELISQKQVLHFLPNAVGQKVLKILADFFIPIDINVEYKIIAKKNAIEFPEKNNPQEEKHKNILGYTVKL